MPKGFACYDFTIRYKYNPQKCQTLLAAAGFEYRAQICINLVFKYLFILTKNLLISLYL